MAACGLRGLWTVDVGQRRSGRACRKRVYSSASGFGDLFGFLGATVAGVGIGALAEHTGWTSVFIVLHSKSKSASEVVQCMRNWTGKARFVLVPTNYPDLIEPAIEKLGKVGMVIYCNHSVRASVKAVRDVRSEMRAAHGAQTVGDRLAALEEVFSLQKDFTKPATAKEA